MYNQVYNYPLLYEPQNVTTVTATWQWLHSFMIPQISMCGGQGWDFVALKIT